ncbi:uncharacterized protein LOC114293449 [Camellia sinensis]|uniref:uncharacterized protein LOC114293449 n=1 Tax=Camellia sinensis TaxID=4442 RepID=UPI0010360787|nr:uncharacterized protein LOC114293449 [Camellia sinensis]
MQKLLLATYTLKEEARQWWILIRDNSRTMTWSQFKVIFYEKYFPQCFIDCQVSEFQELKQGKMSVVEYEAKFTKLARFAPHMVDTNYKKAQKFERGLDLDVFDRVGISKLPTYVEVLARALMAEATLVAMKQAKAPITEWRSKRSGFHFQKGHSSFSHKKQNTGSSSSSSQSSGSMPACSKYGRKHKGMCYRESGACFQCGKTGHMIRDCPMRSDDANHPTTSSVGSTLTTRTNVKTNIERETLRQGQVFALLPGDVQNIESVVSDMISICSMLCAYVYPACDIMARDMLLYADLLPLDITHFDCILGMDLLTKYCVTIDCVSKTVVFQPLGMLEFVFVGNWPAMIEEIKEKQLDDEFLKMIVDEFASKPRPGFVFGNNVLNFHGRLCVLDCSDLRK